MPDTRATRYQTPPAPYRTKCTAAPLGSWERTLEASEVDARGQPRRRRGPCSCSRLATTGKMRRGQGAGRGPCSCSRRGCCRGLPGPCPRAASATGTCHVPTPLCSLTRSHTDTMHKAHTQHSTHTHPSRTHKSTQRALQGGRNKRRRVAAHHPCTWHAVRMQCL